MEFQSPVLKVKERKYRMSKKAKKKKNFVKTLGFYFGIVLVLTFLSKSIYNYQLPVVMISSPEQGEINDTIAETAEVSYSHVNSIYAEVDGRVKNIIVQEGDEVKKGQCIMMFEMAGTKEIKPITAENNGIIYSIGVKKGMYVSSMQNTILYQIAEIAQEWSVAIFVTDEQKKYVDIGGTAKIEIEDVNEIYSGDIQAITPYAEQSRKGYMVEIQFFSDNKELSGKQAKVSISKSSQLYDALIPTAALRKDAIGYYVLVLKEEDSVLGNGYTAQRVSVDLLDSDEEYCAVRGITFDEQVIVAATSEISDGNRVYYEGDTAK